MNYDVLQMLLTRVGIVDIVNNMNIMLTTKGVCDVSVDHAYGCVDSDG